MPIYMQYGSISGEVVSTGQLQWVEVNSFQWGVGRGLSSPTGGSAGSGSCQGTCLSDPGRERLQPGSKPGLEQGSKQKEEGLSIKDLSSFRQHASGRTLGILFLGNRCLGKRRIGLS